MKEALFKKNDALAIAEELREALADSERKTLPLRASALRAAQHYANAHDAGRKHGVNIHRPDAFTPSIRNGKVAWSDVLWS